MRLMWRLRAGRSPNALAIVLGLLLSVALMPPASVLADHGVLDAAVATELQSALDTARRKRPIPGISAAIQLANGQTWTGVSGVGRVGTGSWPVLPGTPFVIGSITKTFVAATIMQLAEEGLLTLEDRMAEWLPDHPRGDLITLRQLLSHTSGEFNYFESPSYESLVFGRPSHIWTPDEILTLVGAPRFEPGTDWDYSNTNFILLGLVAEAAGGEAIGDAIERRFLDPLGLDDTTFQTPDSIPAAAARGYLRSSGQWIGFATASGLRPNPSAATVAWAAGAMVSTASDLAIWARALYGGRVLEPGSLAQMVAFNDDDYGLGTELLSIGGRDAWGHNGSLRGFDATMRYVPTLDAAVVALWNRGRVDSAELSHELGGIVFSHLYPDTTAPTVEHPSMTFQVDATAAPGSVPVRIRWPASDDESGIESLEALHSVDLGPWSPVGLAAPERPVVEMPLATGRTHAFAFRATDAEGNASEWVQTPPFRPKVVQERSTRIARDVSWTTASVSDALGGALAYTKTTGAIASLSFDALAFGWIAPRAPLRGKATWLVDGVATGTVDLRADAREARVVVAANAWPVAGPHAFEVRSLGTVGRPRIDIDAFALLLAMPGSPPPP